MRDGISNVVLVDMTTDTLSGTTPNASAWLDTRGFDAASIIVLTNAVTDAGTASGFTGTLQESDLTTAVSATDVAVADAVGGVVTVTVTSDTDDNIIAGKVSYLGKKRYIRMNYVGTTLTDAIVRTVGMLQEPARAPTTFIGTSVAAT